jgi:RimJ/RimL family protein N-acetyltransferase
MMNLESERLILKEITWDDLDDIHRLHSFSEVDEFNTLGIPENIDDTRKVIKPLIRAKDVQPQKIHTWKIILKNNKKFAGLAGMNLSLDKFRLGEIYYKFLPDHWGNGYATEVARLLINTGFESFQLHKVEAGVATGNLRSIRVLEKAGMTREGLRRKILPIRGEWVDNYHYAIVEDDPRDY